MKTPTGAVLAPAMTSVSTSRVSQGFQSCHCPLSNKKIRRTPGIHRTECYIKEWLSFMGSIWIYLQFGGMVKFSGRLATESFLQNVGSHRVLSYELLGWFLWSFCSLKEEVFFPRRLKIGDTIMWVFPKIGVPKNGWWKSWKTLLKLMISGVKNPIFGPLNTLSLGFASITKFIQVKLTKGCFHEVDEVSESLPTWMSRTGS